MGVFLAEKDLKGLKQYKYSSIDKSLLSKYVLKPFYSWFVTLFPQWVAPNLITLGGLAFTGIGVLTVLHYNPNFDQEMPSWVYASLGIEMFLYQTFDACDGLQARRTGQSSPLGELFDHTIDAINTSFGVILISAVLNLSPALVLTAQFLTTLNFYLSTWEEFHTGTLYLSIFSGPVEGVLMLTGIFFLTAFTGTGIWMHEIVFGLSFYDVWIPFSVVSLLFNVSAAFRNVMKTVPGGILSLVPEILPFIGFWVSVVGWLNFAPFLLESHIIPVILIIGISVAMTVGRIITAHVTNAEKLPLVNPLQFVPVFNILGHAIAHFSGWDTYTTDITLIWISLGISIGIYGSFVAEIIYEITSFLDIGCLYIKYPKKSD